MTRDGIDPQATERRLAYLASFPEQNPNPVLEIDREGVVRYANPAARSAFPGLVEERPLPAPLAAWRGVAAETEEGPRTLTVGERTYEIALQTIEHSIVRMYAVDRTERARAAAALRDERERLRLLVEHAPAGVAMFDRDMRYLMASKRFLHDHRVTFSDITGLSHYEVFPEIPERWKQVHRRCLAGAIERCEEDPFPRGDGTIDWVRWEIHPWRTEAGEIGGLILFSEVITDRKRAEEALRASEQRLRLAQEVARVGTFEWNIQTGANIWTPELEAMYGLPPGGFAGTQTAWESLVHPDDRAEVVRRVGEAVESGAPIDELEWRVVWPDGSVHWLAGRAQVFKDAGGTPLRLTGINIDITDRKRAEEAVRRSEATLEAFFASSPGILNIEDDEFRYLKTDPLTPTYFGLTRETIVGKAVSDLAPEFMARFGPMMRRVVETGEPRLHQDVYSPAPTEPGRTLHWRASYFPVPLPGGKRGLGIVGMDVTDMKSAEEQLVSSREQLRSLVARMNSVREEEKALLSRDLHDEMGQLLTALKFELDVLEDEVGSAPPSDASARLVERSVAASELVEQAIRAMQGITASLRPAALERLGLGSALRQEGRAFEQWARVACEVTVPEDLPGLGSEIEIAVFRVAQEALTNVARHARASRVHVSLELAHGAVVLCIADDGSGMQGGARRLRLGTGLGLLGMSERAERLGGDLVVEPGPEGGTVVTSRIPFTSAPASGGDTTSPAGGS